MTATATLAAALAAASDAWLRNPWLVWGVGPILSSAVGFYVVALILEVVLARGWMDRSLICYASNSNAPRKQLLAATQQRIPASKQAWVSFKTLLAPPESVINAALLAVGMRLVGGMAATAGGWLPASAAAGALQLVALAILNDLGLYWGHRIQHESKFLWQFHAIHHSIDTPSPYSTMYIHPLDAALQGSIPMALAAIIVRPAPAIGYLFFAARVGENTLNHSGLDSLWLDMLTLKCLPFRASAAFHDAHHKYSNHAYNAKNYAESLWIWDMLFGTSSRLTGRRLPAAVAASAAAPAAAAAAAAGGMKAK